MGERYLDASAEISEDGLYRYCLTRRLSMGDRTVLFVGLNPSTADGEQDDPTIRRCVGFARRWGFDRLCMANLYAYRSTDPKRLPFVADAVGPLNQGALTVLVGEAELIVAAWGANKLTPHARGLANWILSQPSCRCLGQNADGTPKHPLYLPKTAELREVGV